MIVFRNAIAACLLIVPAVPAVLLAQTAPPAKPAAKAAAKADTKASAKPAAKPAAKPVAKTRANISRSAAKAVEEVTLVDPTPEHQLSAAELEIAKKIFVGTIPCELGNAVTITPLKFEGFFRVETKGARYRMHPVESRTGAIRLEDPNAGAMWLQLGNKSMLMNQKQGLRLADECASPAQITFADEMKKNNTPGLLDAPARP